MHRCVVSVFQLVNMKTGDTAMAMCLCTSFIFVLYFVGWGGCQWETCPWVAMLRIMKMMEFDKLCSYTIKIKSQVTHMYVCMSLIYIIGPLCNSLSF